VGVVDVWTQQPNAAFAGQPWLASLLRWTGQSRQDLLDADLEGAMDAAGVAIALLSAWSGPTGELISNDEVASAVARNPGRLRGVATADVRSPVAACREVRRCVIELGFVALRVVPWLWQLPPNDRRFYPVYATCAELGVPVCTQIGHTGPLLPSEFGRPIPYLDDVLLDFPDLVVVGGHVGFPWMDEVLSLCFKYPNFHVDTSAYAVHRLPPTLIDYLRGAGRSRVLFGSNWPMISPARALERLDELGLDLEATELFLSANARRVFGLDADRHRDARADATSGPMPEEAERCP
jgi:predicted TIM-barrel fold metal-dependent hydrolase